jgi:predicted metal-binding protein
MAARLHVCITCKAGESLPDGSPLPGARLHAALEAARAALPPDVPDAPLALVPVSCLSACSQGCSVALSAPGKWSYVYGRLSAADAPEILRGAALYAASADGIVPWRERPEIFRRQSLARVPPMES